MAKCEGYSITGTSGVNGDAYYISPDNMTFLLSDGASGAGSKGKVLMSNLCVKTIKNHSFSLSGLSPKDYLDQLIWTINDKLISVSQKEKCYIFDTILIGVVYNNIATIAAIGDSSAFFIRRGETAQIAKTRKTYYNLVEAGLYSEQQLERSIHQLPEHMWSMFDRYIPMVVPDYAVEEIRLESKDILVFCCDGVSDYVKPDYIREAINEAKLSESIQTIINTAKENSIRERNCVRFDDLTMIVYIH